MWSERKRAHDLVGETADPYRKNGPRAQRNEHDLPRAGAAAAVRGRERGESAAAARGGKKLRLGEFDSRSGWEKKMFFGKAWKNFFRGGSRGE